jgi:hypothetical protein
MFIIIAIVKIFEKFGERDRVIFFGRRGLDINLNVVYLLRSVMRAV